MTDTRLKRLGLAIRRAAAAIMPVLCAFGPATASGQTQTMGEWSAPFPTENVMIHASVLPNGKVLYWGRREIDFNNLRQVNDGNTLDQHDCIPRIWDPANGAITRTPSPGYNLFCAGHSFLPDGRLFVAGGHLFDFAGSPRATIYDYKSNTWSAVDGMKGGRWYPTVVTLPDGGVLVSFGANEHKVDNTSQQVWKDGHWRELVNFNGPPLYPRMHVVGKDGSVFMSGPFPLTQFLDTGGAGGWRFLVPGDFDRSSRKKGDRRYAPSVMYDEGKVVFIGGGLNEEGGPTKAVEVVDLNASNPAWEETNPMRFARRQHNATLLPDGTVLVMGGTQGNGFNNLTIGEPLRSAELWDPKDGQWTTLAKASVDRTYHSIALLLPDARVLSAGGGEYRPNAGKNKPNAPHHTHRDAQIFSPPYLFRPNGTRADQPEITAAPNDVAYGETFDVGTPHPADVAQVNWVRLSSVTHSFNFEQRINFLKFTKNAGTLKVTAPAEAKLCPPGHYMLFVIDKDNVPSVAKIVQIHP